MTFEATGGSSTVVVTTTAKWTATASPNWISIDQPEGTGRQLVTISALANPLAKERIGKVSFLPFGCTTGAIEIKITQKAGTADISVISSGNDATKLVYAYNEISKDDNKFFLIETNSAWTIQECSDLTVYGGSGEKPATPTGGTKVYVFPTYENTLAKTVSHNIDFAAQGTTLSYVVEQGPAPVAITSPSSEELTLNFGCMASVKEAQYAVNVDADKISTSLVSTGDGVDWVTLGTPGASATEVTVTDNVATKDRSCTMVLKFAGETPMDIKTMKVTIIQSKAESIASLSREIVIFSGEGGTQTIDLTTNADATWEATVNDSPDWLTITPSGTGSGSIDITATANGSVIEQRSAEASVTFTFKDGETEPKNFIIRQEQAATTLTADKTQFVIDAAGQADITVQFTSNVDFTTSGYVKASKNVGPWLKPLSIINGMDEANKQLTFTVEPNNTTTERTATIQVTAGPEGNMANVQLTIIQKAQPSVAISSVTPNQLVFNPAAGLTKEIKLNAQNQGAGALVFDIVPPVAESYFVATDAGDGYIHVTTLKQNSEKERKGTLVITVQGISGDTQEARVELTQLYGTDEMTISPSSFDAKAVGEPHVTVTVSSSTPWNVALVEPESDWISITSASSGTSTPTSANGDNGDDVTFTLENNTTAYTRTATVRFDAGTAYQYLNITQEAGANSAIAVYNGTASITELNLDADVLGEPFTKVLSVKSNTVWTAQVIGAGSSEEAWLTITDPIPDLGIAAGEENGDLHLGVLPNTAREQRACELVFTAGGVYNTTVLKVLVVQNPANEVTLSVDNTQIDFTAAESQTQIIVKSNSIWTASVVIGGDWMSVTGATENNQDGAFKIHVDSNPSYSETREGRITIVAGDDPSNQKVVILYVVQAPRKPITVNPSSLVFDARGTVTLEQTQTVYVLADDDAQWYTTASDSWISFTEEGNDIAVTVEPNVAKEAREGKITLTNVDNLAKFDLLITQKASDPLFATFSKDLLEVNGRAQTVKVPVSSNDTTFHLTPSVGWITATQSVDLVGVDIAVTENTTGVEREGTVTLYVGNFEAGNYATATLTVKQAAQTMTASPKRIYADALGNLSSALTVEGTVSSFEANVGECDWINLEGVTTTYLSGALEGYSTVIPFTVETNEENTERFADIVINGGGKTEFVRVIQKPHKLTLSGTAAFNALSSTRSITVYSTEEWDALALSATSTGETINENPGWLSIDAETRSGYGNGLINIVVEDNATGADRYAVVVVATPTRSASIIVSQSGTNENFWTTLGVGYVSKLAVEQEGFVDITIFGDDDSLSQLLWGYYWPNYTGVNHNNRSKIIDIFTPEGISFTGYEVEILGVDRNELTRLDDGDWVTINENSLYSQPNIGMNLHQASFTLEAAANPPYVGEDMPTVNDTTYPFLYGPRMAVVKVTLLGTNVVVAPQYYVIGHQCENDTIIELLN